MFRIRPFESRTLSWWYDQRDQIDTDPPYQRRGNIWNKSAKAYLIDSVLNDFDVPKFYLADFSYANTELNVSNKLYAIIDGKQRFEAIFDFFAGRIVLGADFALYEDPSVDLSGLSLKDLRERYPRLARKFENFNISVVSVITDEEPKINELFLRLNSSRPLSAPEYRNAMKGIVPGLVRDIANHTFFKENIAFATNRGEDQQVAAKFLLVEFRGDLVDTKKAQLDKLFKEGALLGSSTYDVSIDDAGNATDETQLDDLLDEGERAEASQVQFERAANRVNRVLDQMSTIFVSRDSLLRTQGPLVVYYWFVRQSGPSLGIREFLINFERERQENRELARRNTELPVDEDYLRYDTFNRSINDTGSLQGRFRILVEKYRATERLG